MRVLDERCFAFKNIAVWLLFVLSYSKKSLHINLEDYGWRAVQSQTQLHLSFPWHEPSLLPSLFILQCDVGCLFGQPGVVMTVLDEFWKRGCRNIPTVPKTHTKTKIQRNRRSITMATYFQSSLTCKRDSDSSVKRRGRECGGFGACADEAECETWQNIRRERQEDENGKKKGERVKSDRCVEKMKWKE